MSRGLLAMIREVTSEVTHVLAGSAEAAKPLGDSTQLASLPPLKPSLGTDSLFLSLLDKAMYVPLSRFPLNERFLVLC